MVTTPKIPQPQPGDQMLGMACSYQQIGDKYFVVINCGTAMLATTLVLEIEAARNLSEAIKDTAETAAAQIIKPPSMLS
jgi:hypothetical protein